MEEMVVPDMSETTVMAPVTLAKTSAMAVKVSETSVMEQEADPEVVLEVALEAALEAALVESSKVRPITIAHSS